MCSLSECITRFVERYISNKKRFKWFSLMWKRHMIEPFERFCESRFREEVNSHGLHSSNQRICMRESQQAFKNKIEPQRIFPLLYVGLHQWSIEYLSFYLNFSGCAH